MNAWVMVIAVSLIEAVTPALAADASNGQRLAQRWCSGCHLVSASQSTATDQVPPFATIAKMPGFDAAKVALCSRCCRTHDCTLADSSCAQRCRLSGVKLTCVENY